MRDNSWVRGIVVGILVAYLLWATFSIKQQRLELRDLKETCENQRVKLLEYRSILQDNGLLPEVWPDRIITD